MRPAYTARELDACNAANERLAAWILEESRKSLRDVNRDGVVSCVDYSVAFKETWDRLLWARTDRCDFVWNKNPVNGMNHMFIVVQEVYYPWDTVYIEPQSKVTRESRDKSGMYMDRHWGGRYDPAYNMTDFRRLSQWLDKCEWDSKGIYYMQHR